MRFGRRRGQTRSISTRDAGADGPLSRLFVARVAATLFMLCGLVIVASPLLPTPPAANQAGIVAAGLAAVLVGLVAWVLPWARWPRPASLALVLAAFAVIALNNHYGGADPYRYSVFFLVTFTWIGMAHPRGTALLFAPPLVVAYLIPLATAGHWSSAAAGSVVYVTLVCVVIADMVAWVSARLGRTREELRASQERLRTVMSNAPIILYTLDDGGVFTFAEGQGLATLGFASGQAVGVAVSDAYRNAPEVLDATRRALAGEALTFTSRTGGRVWDNQVVPLRAEDGGVTGIIGVATDVTERKQAERALARAQRHTAAILDAAGEGIFGVDGRGVTTFINPAAARLLGYAPGELIGRPMHATTHHTRADGTPYPAGECPIYAAFADGAVHRADDEVFWRKDGTPIPVEYVSTPLHEEGRLVGAVVTFRDIAERRQAEETLRASELRFRSVTQAASDAIVAADSRGRIISWNAGATAIFGYGEGEMVGRPLTTLMPERYREAHARGLERHGATGETRVIGQTVELHGLRGDGTEFPLELSLATWTTAEGTFYSGIMRDITARKRAKEALEHQALHDALTDLPNRTLLMQGLEETLAPRATAGDGVPVLPAPLALLLLDLDRFKEVNDTFGHHVGDLLLCQVAVRLRGTVRAGDTVARLGGDEFAVLLPGTDEAGATTVARDLHAALGAPLLVEGQALHIGGSIGVALAPTHAGDATTALRCADVAMYVAKRAGLGHAVYDPTHDGHDADRLTLAGDLRLALNRDELLLHYQPKVALGGGHAGRMVGVEALVRWRHPRLGLIPPDRFIPLAEQTGLIASLTTWVLEAALRQARTWARDGLELGVAVNLSMRNLHDPALPRTVADLLARYDVPPDQVCLELTESAVMADVEGSRTVLERLSALGVRLAVDDFGTGYSSLAYLARLPVNELKIDRSFVRHLTTDGGDATIVASTIGLGHALGLSVVVEGVENAETWALLDQMGCDVAQGYYLSRPLPADELERWARRPRAVA